MLPVEAPVGAPDDPLTLFLFILIVLELYPFCILEAEAVLLEDLWEATLVLFAANFFVLLKSAEVSKS